MYESNEWQINSGIRVDCSFFKHFIGDFFIVFDFELCATKLGLAEVDAITGDGAPVDISGILIQIILFDHFIDDLIAEHIVPFFPEIIEERGAVVFCWFCLALSFSIQMHVSIVL